MKYRLIAAIVAVCATSINMLHAQDLRQYIPLNAKVVGDIDGKEVIKTFKNPSLKQHFLSKFVLESFVTNFTDEIDSFQLEELGINANAKSHYFYQNTDSISYTVQILPLQNLFLFKEKISTLDGTFIHNEEYTIYNVGENNFYIWNDKALLILEANLNPYKYYKDPNNKWGLKNVNFYDFYDFNNTAQEAISTTIQEAIPAVEEATTHDIPYSEDDITIEIIPTNPDNDNADDTQSTSTALSNKKDASYQKAQMQYDSAYETQQKLIDSVTKLFALSYIDELITQKQQSILTDKKYLKTQRKPGYAHLYIKNFDVFSGIPNSPLNAMLGLKNNLKSSIQDNTYIARLYYDKSQAALDYEIRISKTQAKNWRKAQKRKLNKNLLKYINTDKHIAYFSHAIHTEHYIHMLYNTYEEALDPQTNIGAAANAGTELVRLLIDEKAIGKAFKGDGLFIVTDVTPHKYNYTSYDYGNEDNDWALTEIVKEKQETLPDFLYLYSTENPRVHRKLLEAATHVDNISKKNGIYTFSYRKNYGFPYQLHLLVKNNIVFWGTNLADMERIAFDKFDRKNHCKLKRNMRKHSYYGYFKPENIVNKIRTEDLTYSLKINNFFDKMGTFEWKQPKMKGQTMKGHIKANTPDASLNGFEYLINTIDNVFDIFR